MGISSILQIVLTLGQFVFKYFGASDEKMKWLAEAADKLREKGWLRNNFVLELEKDRDDHLNEKLKKAELDENGTRVNK